MKLSILVLTGLTDRKKNVIDNYFVGKFSHLFSQQKAFTIIVREYEQSIHPLVLLGLDINEKECARD